MSLCIYYTRVTRRYMHEHILTAFLSLTYKSEFQSHTPFDVGSVWQVKKIYFRPDERRCMAWGPMFDNCCMPARKDTFQIWEKLGTAWGPVFENRVVGVTNVTFQIWEKLGTVWGPVWEMHRANHKSDFLKYEKNLAQPEDLCLRTASYVPQKWFFKSEKNLAWPKDLFLRTAV